MGLGRGEKGQGSRMRLRAMLIVLALISAGVEAAEPKRVLVIHTFG